MTFQELCDRGLVEQFARLKGVSPYVLFKELNGTDEMIITPEEAQILRGEASGSEATRPDPIVTSPLPEGGSHG